MDARGSTQDYTIKRWRLGASTGSAAPEPFSGGRYSRFSKAAVLNPSEFWMSPAAAAMSSWHSHPRKQRAWHWTSSAAISAPRQWPTHAVRRWNRVSRLSALKKPTHSHSDPNSTAMLPPVRCLCITSNPPRRASYCSPWPASPDLEFCSMISNEPHWATAWPGAERGCCHGLRWFVSMGRSPWLAQVSLAEARQIARDAGLEDASRPDTGPSGFSWNGAALNEFSARYFSQTFSAQLGTRP